MEIDIAMNIFITLDYEIYFGENTGTVEKCIIYPTNELIKIANKHRVKFSFFIDCGFLIKLDEYRKKYPVLETDYRSVRTQLERLSNEGHDLQLHIHPHWEDSFYDGEKWRINVKRYKLSDFDQNEINDIIKRYKNKLMEFAGKPIIANRAGGWCLQPFDKLKNSLIENEVLIDSTVFKNGRYVSENYFYDFRNAPDKTLWHFENDPMEENEKGSFTEIPISSHKVSLLFFWKLFLLGRWNPYLHKPLGDGFPISAPGQRFRLLTSFTNQTVSIDGYNANLLQKALTGLVKKKIGNEFVVIGHPKALSRFSLVSVDEFIGNNKLQHNFTTYNQEYLPA